MQRPKYSPLAVIVSSGVTVAAVIGLSVVGCGSSDSSTNGSPDAEATFDATGDDATSGDATLSDAGADDGETDAAESAMDASDATTDVSSAADADASSMSGDAAEDAESDADADASDAFDASDASDASDAGDAGTILLFGGSATALLGGQLHPGGSWSTSTLTGATSFGTSLTMTSAGVGVGVYTASNGSTVNATIWSGGAWSAPAPITTAAIARDQPFVDATGGTTAHLVFQDTSYKFNYLAYAGAWTTTVEAISFGGVQSYGPVPAAVAARGSDCTVGFVNGAATNTNHATAQDRTAAAWQASADILSGSSTAIAPSLVSLSSGPELMMIYIRNSDGEVMFATRTNGTWTTPVPIANALTNNRVALAPLPSGGAIVAFRGTDTNLYWSTYSGGAWSTVASFATPNVSVTASPAVTHGIGGDTAEIAFVEGDGSAYHARLSSGTWSTPVLVGGTDLVGVAIASTP